MSFGQLFSFAGPVAFTVARQIRQNGVSDRHLRRHVATLAVRTGHDNPLADASVIERMATSGDSFLAQAVDDEYDDIGRGGQGTFKEVVRMHLKRIELARSGRTTRRVRVAWPGVRSRLSMAWHQDAIVYELTSMTMSVVLVV